MGMMQQMFAGFPTTSGAPGVTTDALFAYVSMLLNGDSGAAFNADASTNNFAITPVATVRNDTFNPFRDNGYYSNYFNGTTDYLTAPSNSAFTLAGNFTIEGWIYPQSTSPRFLCIGDAGTAGGNTGLLIYRGSTSGSPIVLYQNLGARLTGTIGLFDNIWYHIAVVRSGTTVTLYVNGANSGTWTSSSTLQGGVTIGAQYINGGYSGSGALSISNLRIVKDTAVYTSAFTPPTSPLSAITNTSLLTCQSSRFKDNSTNAFAITLAGTPAVKPSIPFTYVDTAGSAYMNGATSGLSSLALAGNAALQVTSQDFTIECWVYPQLPNLSGHDIANNFIWSDCDSATNNGGILITLNATQLVFGWWTSANALTTASAAFPASNFNAWSHIAVSRVGTSVYLCVNGTVTTISGPSPYGFVGGFPTIGQMGAYATNPGAGYRQFSGYMSNFRFVKGTALYTANFTPPSAPLTAITNTSLLTLQTSLPANNKGFYDSSVNKAPYVPGGNPAQGTFTPYSQTGWSGYFDGTADYLSVASNALFALGSAFTAEAWIFPVTVTTSAAVMCGTSNTGIQIGYSGTTEWGIAVLGLSWRVTSTTLPTLNAWNHIAVSRTGTGTNQTYLFLNGALVATGTMADALTTNSVMTIGAVTGGTNKFNGSISNLRIVKGTALYTSAFTPSTTPLTAIANTSLLTLQSNRIKDNSANNLAITITGVPKILASSPFEPTTSYSVSANGGSTYFNGTTDYIYAVNPSSAYDFGTGNFTLEFWVYPLSGTGGAGSYVPAFYTHNSTGGAQWNVNNGFRIHHGNILFNNTSQFQLNFTSFITNNTWTHIALTRVGTTFTAYKNGVANGTVTNSGAVGSPLNQPALAISDSANTGGREYMNGYISDLRIVNGTAIYTGAFTPPTAPLLPTTYANTTLLLSGTNAGIADSASANNLVPAGNARMSTKVSKFGAGSMYFAADTDNMFMPGTNPQYAFGTGDFTIEAWVYRVAAGNGVIIDFRPVGTVGLYPVLYVGADNLLKYFTNTADRIASSTTLSINTWYHCAISRYSSSTKLFLNGVYQGSYSDSNNYLVGANRPIIGAHGQTVNTLGITGYIDDLRITKGVARYPTTASFTPPTASFPTR